jgi:hypothetical protein
VEDVVDYVPTTYPGARLPHALVSVDGQLVSPHDVLDPNMLTLFTFDGSAWEPVVAGMRDVRPGMSLVVLDAPVGVDRNELISLYEVGESGAVLVRPDGHVAWRTNDSGSSLSDFLETHWRKYYVESV